MAGAAALADLLRSIESLTHARRVLYQLLIEGCRDKHRPWWRRTTGGLLVLLIEIEVDAILSVGRESGELPRTAPINSDRGLTVAGPMASLGTR